MFVVVVVFYVISIIFKTDFFVGNRYYGNSLMAILIDIFLMFYLVFTKIVQVNYLRPPFKCD